MNDNEPVTVSPAFPPRTPDVEEACEYLLRIYRNAARLRATTSVQAERRYGVLDTVERLSNCLIFRSLRADMDKIRRETFQESMNGQPCGCDPGLVVAGKVVGYKCAEHRA